MDMKKFKTLLIFLLAFIILSQPVAALAGVSYFEPSQAKFVTVKTAERNGKIMAPFKKIFQSFGAVVSWNEITKTSSAAISSFLFIFIVTVLFTALFK